MPADHETPVSAFRKLDDGAYAFLLESLEGGEKWGRFSVLGSRPTLVFTARGERCEILEDGVTRPCAGPPLEELRALLAARQAVALPGLPRFCGGAVGYLGCGAARWFERRPAPTPDRARTARRRVPRSPTSSPSSTTSRTPSRS